MNVCRLSARREMSALFMRWKTVAAKPQHTRTPREINKGGRERERERNDADWRDAAGSGGGSSFRGNGRDVESFRRRFLKWSGALRRQNPPPSLQSPSHWANRLSSASGSLLRIRGFSFLFYFGGAPTAVNWTRTEFYRVLLFMPTKWLAFVLGTVS